MKRRGFTLAEVICVIAIIAIVAALVFPSFVSAKRQAKVTSCAGRQAQVGKALLLYAHDNDDWAPPWSTSNSGVSAGGFHYKGDPKQWKSALNSYGSVEENYWCPLDPHRGKGFRGFMEPGDSWRWKQTSYMMNITFSPSLFGSRDGIFRLNLTALPTQWKLSPSETVYVSDAIGADQTAPEGVNRLIGTHDKGRRINALYLDGHVKHGIVEDL